MIFEEVGYTNSSHQWPNRSDSSVAIAPYFIGLGRAMVSLGPISPTRFCSYRCKFCYVQGPFPKYASATPEEIVSWLSKHRGDFDIVYISGDTDSFAQPRTNEGINLLERLLELKVDVLFTTRFVFSGQTEERLFSIAAEYRRRELLLIGCVSVSQLNNPTLEPRPIASPHERISQLGRMRNAGIVTALTIRPLISAIPSQEYVAIAELGKEVSNVIISGDLYLDTDGTIENLVRSASGLRIKGLRTKQERLDFSLDEKLWEIVEHPNAAHELAEFCREKDIPFFMRSGGAVDWVRTQRSVLLGRRPI